ncbi:ABC transporter substrate-binding protein [Xylanibacter ruminicola]|uniref:Spermidine/putrescine transport system substrate-binding protein n=1 Tax=Xylanibacter ruminicola TaxID=839 RepID=A0A1M6SSD7_XYLRU|nr:ABC transporter substrate-binding protein [Xylanibacter ruminicola]SHK47631.1 spermidine/putrescine transport system substrate-binding protein [Xylanibacter ruminicola]
MKRLATILIAIFCTLGTQAQYDRQKILKVYNWDEYIGKGVIEKFEKWYKEVTGNTIKVEYVTYDYPEDCFAQMQSGQIDADVFCPPEYLFERMMKNGFLHPIDTSFVEKGIPNWMKGTSPFIDNLLQLIGETQGIRAKDYTVGYLWGNTGVLINTKYVKPEEVYSWEFLFDSKFRGKVIMKDSFSDLYNLLINYAFYEEIKAGVTNRNLLATYLTNRNIAIVEDLLEKARPQMKSFDVDDDKRLMADGSNWMSVTWNGDAKWAIDEASKDVNLQYIVPKEGSDCWMDCWVIPACTKNAEAASYWINFICRPDIALLCMDETGYSSAIATPDILRTVTNDKIKETIDLSYFFGPKATAVHVDSVMYPDINTINRCSFLRDSGDRQEVIREIWDKIKNKSVINYWHIAIAGCILLAIILTCIIILRRLRK